MNEQELKSQLRTAVGLLVALRDGTFEDGDWREVAALEDYVVEYCRS